jgi:WD40 repeat protein
MQHTYLRYECADSFGLISTSASSKAPQSNSILAFGSDTREAPILLTTAGSHCMGYHLRTTDPTIKIAQREQLSGGVGTGKALNSDQIVCLDVASFGDNSDTCKVATGWVDGAVRIFDVHKDEMNTRSGCGLIQTTLENGQDDDFVMREPLLLNGHSGSPVRSLAFDSKDGSRLASGSSDGSVVLWDIVAETGLFRLLGHRGGITDIHFVTLNEAGMDLLVSTSLDGLVKIWDLKGQCCIQTIPSHRGEVLAAASLTIPNSTQVQSASDNLDKGGDERIRLVTGSTDGQARVWSIQPSKRHRISNGPVPTSAEKEEINNPVIVEDDDEDEGHESLDDVCQYIGCLAAPPNVSTSSESLSCVHFHPNGKYVGILHSNSKHVDVYLIRSLQESLQKKQRRLRRRREKASKASNEVIEDRRGIKGQKRGILDDPESDGDDIDKAEDEIAKFDNSVDPNIVKASDEFEYFGTVRASHKVKGFIFVPYKESGSSVRIVCSLATNSLEVHSLTRKKERYVSYVCIVLGTCSKSDDHF